MTAKSYNISNEGCLFVDVFGVPKTETYLSDDPYWRSNKDYIRSYFSLGTKRYLDDDPFRHKKEIHPFFYEKTDFYVSDDPFLLEKDIRLTDQKADDVFDAPLSRAVKM